MVRLELRAFGQEEGSAFLHDECGGELCSRLAVVLDPILTLNARGVLQDDVSQWVFGRGSKMFTRTYELILGYNRIIKVHENTQERCSKKLEMDRSRVLRGRKY
jgi:hypothetical protein